MKVLIVNYRYFVSSGPERYMFGVSRLLEQAGHEVVLFSIRYKQNVPNEWSHYFVSPLAGQDAVYFREHVWTPRTIVRTLERAFYSREVYDSLRALLHAERPDVALVLCYLRKLSPSVLCALRDNGVPIVVRLSDFAMVCPQQHLVRDGKVCEVCVGRNTLPSIRHRCVQGSFAASAVNAAAMAVARRRGWFDTVDRFVAPSSVMRQKMVAGGYAVERIVHLPTFVSLQPDECRPQRLRRIVYVGRIDPPKGVGVLIDAFTALRDEADLRDVELMVVGDDSTPEALRLKNRVQRSNLAHVHFVGRVDHADVVRFLSTSLLSVIPSLWHENLPNSLLESLACGTPVVGSNVSSIAEALAGTEAGALFEPGDPGDLSRVLSSLLRDGPRLTAMSLDARRLATTRYDPEAHLNGLLRVFHDVM